MVSQRPKEKAETPRLQRLGVWGSSTQQSARWPYPLKLWRAAMSDIGKVVPAHGRTGTPYRTTLKLLNVPPPVS